MPIGSGTAILFCSKCQPMNNEMTRLSIDSFAVCLSELFSMLTMGYFCQPKNMNKLSALGRPLVVLS
jgi:hypothetical protein